jgi:hypothetical protein
MQDNVEMPLETAPPCCGKVPALAALAMYYESPLRQLFLLGLLCVVEMPSFHYTISSGAAGMSVCAMEKLMASVELS